MLAAFACTTAGDGEPSPAPTLGPSAQATPTQPATPTQSPTPPALPEGLTPALVTRVVDGDTIVVEIDSVEYRVRYIGIDTPETVAPGQSVECYGREASQQNKELVEGKIVGLEKDVSEVDQFGRLLRYVWLAPSTGSGQSVMVNGALVEEGYALASTFPPDVKNSDLFAALQAEAREAGRGLWGATCASPTPVPIEGGYEYSGRRSP